MNRFDKITLFLSFSGIIILFFIKIKHDDLSTNHGAKVHPFVSQKQIKSLNRVKIF